MLSGKFISMIPNKNICLSAQDLVGSWTWKASNTFLDRKVSQITLQQEIKRPMSQKSSDNSSGNDQPTKMKNPLSARTFASRWKRRSLDPTTRISSMLPDEKKFENQSTSQSENSTQNSQTFEPSKPLQFKKRRLSVEDRLKDMMDKNDDDEHKK